MEVRKFGNEWLWVMQEAYDRTHKLGAGEKFLIDHNRSELCLEALSKSSLRVEEIYGIIMKLTVF